MRFTKISVLALLAAMMFFASTASAAIVIGGADGWSFSTDGMVNLFATYQSADDTPAGVNTGYAIDQDGFRIKNGFLPNILAFNIKAPTMKGLDMGARVGFYPGSAHENGKNARFDSQIDLREVFFTIDGDFGQFMIGKGLSLFMGQNLLTEQTLMGAGRLGTALNAGLGVTLGRIGYGYLYPNFNAQIRYTTPDMGGFKAAVALYDPSVINGGGGGQNADGTLVTTVSASETKLPRVEGELSYAGTYGNGNTLKLYTNGMWQEADFTTALADGTDDVTAWGVSGGFVTGMGGFELSGSIFTGEALGTATMLDTDSLDAAGEERETWGYIAQLTYTMANEGKTKFGVSYGANEMDETDADKTDRLDNDAAFLESQSMLTFMVTQDITSNLKLVGEISFLEHEWQNGKDWNAEMFSVGTFFLW
ncbi:hypothetical protein A7E78_08970 [Syntrophotalea acetylenivorans]|uniref:Porin domain-containing protein n=1 Tax=Syntrophotalea acetylenivorans TaxID=1842532 RepID=A0A1L3GPX4_9BACT|nr:histidine kinase [Syntrophotalea acetylenivorans]APG27955.1 hypothetical protein A7E78_08970 [Syntrophotalea acetylenivorans]